MDGSETTETISALISLSELGIEVVPFAPDANQADVYDHQGARTLGYAPRHMMQEAARLTRGGVHALSELNAENFDALVIPGGFGVAKSLSNWATASNPSQCEVIPDLKNAIEQFHALKKPIGLCCIAPVLAAVIFKKVTLTVGKAEPNDLWPYGGTVSQIQSLGATNIPCEVTEIAIDYDHKIVTTPAFMFHAQKHQVLCGVRKMVRNVGWMMN